MKKLLTLSILSLFLSTVQATVQCKLLTSGGDADVDSSSVTASISPQPDALILLVVASRNSNSGATAGTITAAGNSIAYTEMETDAYYTTAHHRCEVMRGLDVAPTTGTIAITFSEDKADAEWQVIECRNLDSSGTEGDGAVVQSAGASASGSGTKTVTLSAFADATNATFGAICCRTSGCDLDPGSGFTQIAETSFATPTILSQWRADNDTSVTFTANADNGTDSVSLVGVEIDFEGLAGKAMMGNAF